MPRRRWEDIQHHETDAAVNIRRRAEFSLPSLKGRTRSSGISAQSCFSGTDYGSRGSGFARMFLEAHQAGAVEYIIRTRPARDLVAFRTPTQWIIRPVSAGWENSSNSYRRSMFEAQQLVTAALAGSEAAGKPFIPFWIDGERMKAPSPPTPIVGTSDLSDLLEALDAPDGAIIEEDLDVPPGERGYQTTD